jgi:hypothetical protein
VSRPIANRRRSVVRRRFDGKSSQELVRIYDEDGPSWVGQFLDDHADLVALMRFRVQVWSSETGAYQWVDMPSIASILEANLIGYQAERVADFVRMLAREVLAVGEAALVEFSTPFGPRWRVLPLDPGSYVVVDEDPKSKEPLRLGWPTEPGATSKDGAPAWVEANHDKIWRIYRPNPRFVRAAMSPLWRALPDVRRFDIATRSLHRLAASTLRLNKILVLKGNLKDLGVTHPNGQEELGPLGRQLDDFLSASDRRAQDYAEDDLTSTIPGIWISEEDNPIEVVDAGPVVDPELVGLKLDALTDAARGLPGPLSALIEGEGAATRLLNDDNLRTAIHQALRPIASVVAHGLTVAVLHPNLPESIEINGAAVPRQLFRVWPDELFLTSEAPVFGDIKAAADAGYITAVPVREALDLSEHAPQLPPGVSEEEYRLQLATAKGRRSAAVDVEEWLSDKDSEL